MKDLILHRLYNDNILNLHLLLVIHLSLNLAPEYLREKICDLNVMCIGVTLKMHQYMDSELRKIRNLFDELEMTRLEHPNIDDTEMCYNSQC